jgi:glycine/D-amino acid oxidase-like deaminating enzyme
MLAAALRRAVIDAGVRVHEGSPMLAIEHGDRPRVRTRSGEVTAERVVLTLGSWTPAHVPAARRGLIVVGSDVITTPPVGELLDEIGVEPGLAISDSRLMVDYFHRTHDDRMVLGVGGSSMAFRGRVGAKFHGETRRAAGVRRQLVRLYPQLAATAEEMNWTGPVDRSVSGLPFIHRDGRVLICAGFSGNGVGPSHLAARILASHAVGIDDRYARCGLVAPPDGGFPPEPFRYLGGKLVRLAVARKERTDDRERVSDPVTRWFANLAPAGLVPTEKA